MTNIANCERCGSQIVEPPHNATRPTEFVRHPDSESVEMEQIKLCSMCLDEIWEFVFETDVDRRSKADPLPIEKLGQNVERHIDDLETVLESLTEAKPNEGENDGQD